MRATRTLVPPVSVFLPLKQDIKVGAKGDGVTRLQQKLQGLGYLAPSFSASGTLDRSTANAVRQYQKDNGLPSIGSLDAKTRDKLNKLSFGPVLVGDFNRDGVVTQDEADRILRYDTGLEKLSHDELVVADADGNGKVNSIDALWAEKIAKGKHPYSCVMSVRPSRNICLAGDLNADGKVTEDEFNRILKYDVGLAQLSDRERLLADADGNGKVDTVDGLFAGQPECRSTATPEVRCRHTVM